ncbi:TPA: hypothetical protein N0F65_011691 [Lagenidium giganteum]|uniref:Uncharacterized protein n=1 Tax=Lagenidium giganteum TaxID=4803 RepID=A0AAV2YWL7_9STRA|nr:TPA: hypothetical protein N0F65_011691 [Lagenidium giganteum]
MKRRCKLLMSNLAPGVLRLEINRLVSLQERAAKTNDVKLMALVLKGAKEQHQFHLMEKERGGPSQPRRPEGGKQKKPTP